MSGPTHRVRLGCVLLCLALVCQGEPAPAFVGPDGRLPSSASPGAAGALSYSPRSGLALDVEGRWFNQHGFRPMRFTVSAASPRPIDRRVAIEVSFAGASARAMRTAPASLVRREVTLAAGATEVEFAISCPPGGWAFVWWSLQVDDDPDPHLSVDRGSALSLGGGRPGLLNVLRDAGPASGLRSGQTLRYRGLGLVVDEVTSPLSDDPIAYTGVDVVRISWPRLQRLAKQDDRVVAALRGWLLTGGSVWVELCGDNEATLGEIESALAVSAWRFAPTDAERETDPLPPAPKPRDGDQRAVRKLPSDDEEDASAEAQAATPVAGHPGWVYPRLTFDTQSDDSSDEGPSPDSRGWFAERDAGFGRLVAFPRRFVDVPTPLLLVGPQAAARRWLERGWSVRHGLPAGGMASEFGNLLADGVGVAPVGMFQVLITLFVLVIGPLNYWLLWRRGQLQLLVITAPLIAGVATLGLFGYALLSDGFGVVERARSVTLLNQSTGEAAWWGRVTHHGGTAQRRPATIPAGVAAYPVRPVWESAVAGDTGTLKTELSDDGARRHSAGWLPSRSAVQHLLVGRKTLQRSLVFAPKQPAPDARGGWSVANRLEADASLVLARADAGWMVAEGVRAGEAAELTAVDRLAATQRLRVAALDNEPMFPVGAGFSVEQTLERLGSRGALRRMQNSIEAVSLAENLMNRMLGSITGLDGGRPLDLPPRSYVAITAERVAVPELIQGADQRDGFHVLIGRW